MPARWQFTCIYNALTVSALSHVLQTHHLTNYQVLRISEAQQHIILGKKTLVLASIFLKKVKGIMKFTCASIIECTVFMLTYSSV